MVDLTSTRETIYPVVDALAADDGPLAATIARVGQDVSVAARQIIRAVERMRDDADWIVARVRAGDDLSTTSYSAESLERLGRAVAEYGVLAPTWHGLEKAAQVAGDAPAT